MHLLRFSGASIADEEQVNAIRNACHLRGHFGIPRFEGDSFKDMKNK